jgi:hypothetical protein
MERGAVPRRAPGASREAARHHAAQSHSGPHSQFGPQSQPVPQPHDAVRQQLFASSVRIVGSPCCRSGIGPSALPSHLLTDERSASYSSDPPHVSTRRWRRTSRCRGRTAWGLRWPRGRSPCPPRTRSESRRGYRRQARHARRRRSTGCRTDGQERAAARFDARAAVRQHRPPQPRHTGENVRQLLQPVAVHLGAAQEHADAAFTAAEEAGVVEPARPRFHGDRGQLDRRLDQPDPHQRVLTLREHDRVRARRIADVTRV